MDGPQMTTPVLEQPLFLTATLGHHLPCCASLATFLPLLLIVAVCMSRFPHATYRALCHLPLHLPQQHIAMPPYSSNAMPSYFSILLTAYQLPSAPSWPQHTTYLRN